MRRLLLSPSARGRRAGCAPFMIRRALGFEMENIASKSALFLEHWTDIGAERMTRYETMYQWSAAAETFYRAADIGHGLVVTDFGCGPGHTTVEFARRIGNDGHMHALDINSEFIERTRQRHIYWKPSAFRCRMRRSVV